MKSSPIGSRVLSAYGIMFAGLAPTALAITAVVNGVFSLPSMLGNIALGVAIVYFGVRVFMGDASVNKVFAALVALNYLGQTASNFLNYEDFPPGSRAAEMAVPRMIRGVLFAGVFVWYYFLRNVTDKKVASSVGSNDSSAVNTSSSDETPES